MRCRSGVIDLPLRLTITLFIIALSLPIADAALQHQQQEEAVRECRAQAASLLDVATLVFHQGEGSTRIFRVDIPQSTSIVVLEGALLLEYEGRNAGMVKVGNPAFLLVTESPMTLTDGDMVRLSSIRVDGSPAVGVCPA